MEMFWQVQAVGRVDCLADPVSAHGKNIGFIHIPKTGGTSFALTIRTEGRQDVHSFDPIIFSVFTDYVVTRPVVYGHIPYFLFSIEQPRRQLVTILREPVARVISAYKYMLQEEQHNLHQYIKHYNLSIAQCFAHPALRIELSNYQSKMIGWEPVERIWLPARTPESRSVVVRALNSFMNEESSQTILARAKQRLLTEFKFGILERQDSVMRLAEGITTQKLSRLIHVNSSRETDYAVTSKDLDAIVDNNLIDLELYDFAKDKNLLVGQ